MWMNPHHAQALLLAIASSTDNFLVGLSLGLSSSSFNNHGKTDNNISKARDRATSSSSSSSLNKSQTIKQQQQQSLDGCLPFHLLWGIAVCNAAGCWLATALGGTLVDQAVNFVMLVHSSTTASSSTTTTTTTSSDHPKQGNDNDIIIDHDDSRLVVVAIPHLLAAVAFGYLAYQEFGQEEDDDKNTENNNNNQTPSRPENVVDEGSDKNPSPSSGSHSTGQQHHQQHQFPSLVSLALPMTLNNLAGGLTGGVALQHVVTPMVHAAYALAVSVVTMWVGFRLGRINPNNNSSTTWNSLAQNVSVALYLFLSAQSLYEAIEALNGESS